MQFIVDLNLPRHFRYFNNPEFVFAADIDPCMTDARIWDLALENNYIILTKDVDFYARSMVAKKRAKVIYFNIGNMTIAQLHGYFEKNWDFLKNLITKHELIVAKVDSVDVLI